MSKRKGSPALGESEKSKRTRGDTPGGRGLGTLILPPDRPAEQAHAPPLSAQGEQGSTRMPVV